MKYILPIKHDIDANIVLPQIIYKDKKIKISLDHLNIEQKKNLLNLEKLEISERKGIMYSFKEGYQVKDDEYTKHIRSNLQFIFEYEPEPGSLSDSYIYGKTDLFNTLLLIIIGTGSSVSFDLDNNGKLSSSGKGKISFVNAPEESEMHSSKLDTLKIATNNLFKLEVENDKKRKLIFSLFEIAKSSSNPLSLRCSLFVTILESLFSTKDEKSEISYRFPLRMTKFLGADYENTFKKIRKYYSARSSYYHTGEEKFSNEDLKDLEYYNQLVIIKYLEDKSGFSGKNLDKLLLD